MYTAYMVEDQTTYFLLLFDHNLINYSHTSIICLCILSSVFVGVYYIDHRQLHHIEHLFSPLLSLFC